MRNWLGQELQVGDVVYRGARDGNNSSFRLGIVEHINPLKRTAKIAWQFEDGWHWCHPERVSFVVPRKMTSTGSPTIDSLVVVDSGMLYELQSVYALVQDAVQRKLSADDFEQVTGIERNV